MNLSKNHNGISFPIAHLTNITFLNVKFGIYQCAVHTKRPPFDCMLIAVYSAACVMLQNLEGKLLLAS